MNLYQLEFILAELVPKIFNLFLNTTLLHPASRIELIMIRGTTLRGLLTPRSVPIPGCHHRISHAYTARRLIHGSPKRPHEVLGTAARQPEAEPFPVQKPNERVTVNDIKERRAKAGKLVAGVAAYCDSDMFKAPVSPLMATHCSSVSVTKGYLQSVGKPKAKRWDRTYCSQHFPENMSLLY